MSTARERSDYFAQRNPPTTDGATDLGGGVFVRPFVIEPGNFLWRHPGCESWHIVDVTTGGNHRVEQVEPLTLSPSLLCPVESKTPRFHGWIREGRWVPA